MKTLPWRLVPLLLREAQDPLFVHQPVDAAVALAPGAHRPRNGHGLAFLGVNAILIDNRHIELHGTMLARLDDAVRRRAFARQVEVNEQPLVVLHGCNARSRCWWTAPRTCIP